MIQTSQLRAGRVYSIIYRKAVELVQNRNGQANPLQGAAVESRKVFSVRAAGHKTWERIQKALGIAPNPASTQWQAHTANPAIIRHASKSQLYFRCEPLANRHTKTEYFVNGQPATAEQVATIENFKRASSDAKLLTLKIEQVENLSLDESLLPATA